MIADVVFRSLRSRSQMSPVEELLNGCAGSRMPEVIPDLLTTQIVTRAAEICPTGAITAEVRDRGGLALRLDYGECIGCGRCADVGEGALRWPKLFVPTGCDA